VWKRAIAEAPTLLTLHSAKGLEFPVVFIVGLADGSLPHSRSLEDGEELAEERRLFYVGLTRAIDRVFLSYPFRRTSFGESQATVPSRFLHDIPVELVEGSNLQKRRRVTIEKASSWDWSWSTPKSHESNVDGGRVRSDLPEPSSRAPSQPSQRARVVTEAKYSIGQNVYHQKFGEGVVIASKLTGIDEEVDVAFSGLGVKKLVASMAKLEIRE
jgi:DNA helicase-2/ATP-dependent DNA helicase PcrA